MKELYSENSDQYKNCTSSDTDSFAIHASECPKILKTHLIMCFARVTGL